MLGLTELTLTRTGHILRAPYFGTGGIAPDCGSDRTGDRAATRHATGLVIDAQRMGFARVNRKHSTVSIWPYLGAELVTWV